MDAEGKNTSSMIMVNHLKKDVIIQLEELPRYTAISFISDVGGILGIFLGFSFYAIYEYATLIPPYIKKVTKAMKEKKKANAAAEPGEAKGKKGKKKKAGEPKEVKVEPAKDAVDDSTPSGDTTAKAIEEVVTEA